jgi:ATP:cob(I)alamin adenosyltransferase
MDTSSDGGVQSITERLARIEQLMPSIQARLKTVERNAPLEVRLRRLEQHMESDASSHKFQFHKPFMGLGHAVLALRKHFVLFCQAALLPITRASFGAAQAQVQKQNHIPSDTATSCKQNSSVFSTASNVEEPSLRLSQDKNPEVNASVRALHRDACANAQDTYKDPATGFDVFTSHYLRTRDCCGSGCRHCPWGHRNVPSRRSIAPASETCAPKSTLYTRKGDTGWTNLYNEEWVMKSLPVYDAIGDIDELNSVVGLAREILSQGSDCALSQQLEILQGWLLDVGSTLCTPRNKTQNVRKLQRTSGITNVVVADLETWIDQGDDALRLLRHFILPGGSPGGGALHLARTICRRAERHTWPLILRAMLMRFWVSS